MVVVVQNCDFSHYKNLSFKGDMLLNDAEIVKLI